MMSFGNMGGGTEPQAHAQHVVNMIDLGYNVQATSDAARFDHDQVSDRLRMDIYLEEAIGDQLRLMGHDVEARRGLGGGYQGILFEWITACLSQECLGAGVGVVIKLLWMESRQGPVNGVYRAVFELRKDGMAAGF